MSPTPSEAHGSRPSRDIGNLLKTVDWSFSSRSTPSLIDCRKYHWYPGTFIPEIPFSLIEILAPPGARVYDPFAGIGTTAMQALLLGHEPLATESCRVAVTVARSLWTLLRPTSDLVSAQAQLRELMDDYDKSVLHEEKFPETDPRWGLRAWFAPATFRQLAYLAHASLEASDEALSAYITLCTSNVLKSTSAQKGGWGCIADNMVPESTEEFEADVFSRLTRVSQVVLRDLTRIRQSFDATSYAQLLRRDAQAVMRHVDLTEISASPFLDIDLIVTSPPYPGMTDYATSQRLSYYWLGLQPESDLRREIGARRKRFAASSLEQYRREMTTVLAVLTEAMAPGGRICLVLPEFGGRSANDERRKASVQEVLASLPRQGMIFDHRMDRVLPERRRHHNAHWTTLEREGIYIYRRSR